MVTKYIPVKEVITTEVVKSPNEKHGFSLLLFKVQCFHYFNK